MAQLREILDTEKRRESKKSLRVIHLYKEGSFYRAYDFSSWLMVKFVKSDMKVTRKQGKGNDIDFTFVGFPVTSLMKYTPEGATSVRADKDNPNKDKVVDTILPETVFDDYKSEGGTLFEEEDLTRAMIDEYEAWKQSVPIVESKPKDKPPSSSAIKGMSDSLPFCQDTQGHQPKTLLAIMQETLQFQIEKSSPMDCMLFLIEVRHQLTRLLM